MESKKANKPIPFNVANYKQRLEPEIFKETSNLFDLLIVNILNKDDILNDSIQRNIKKNSFLYELGEISKRALVNMLRNPVLLKSKIIMTGN